MTNARIQTPTPALEKSASFYKRLGFQQAPDAPVFSDGALTIRINPDRFARTGLELVRADWSAQLDKLKTLTSVVEHKGTYVLSAPSGVRVYLVNSEAPPPEPAPASCLGTFAGLSVETLDLGRELSFWEALDYSPKAGGADQGWIQLSNGSIDVSVMPMFTCPHLFPNPGLTYFNSGKNPEVIKAIRAADVPLFEEVTCFNEQGIVDNVLIQDPGGTGFFIFND